MGVAPNIDKTSANINLSQFLMEEKDYFGFDSNNNQGGGIRQSAIQQNLDDPHSLQLDNIDYQDGNQTSIDLSQYLEEAYQQPGYQVKYAEEDEIKLSMDSRQSDKKGF